MEILFLPMRWEWSSKTCRNQAFGVRGGTKCVFCKRNDDIVKYVSADRPFQVRTRIFVYSSGGEAVVSME